MTSAEVPPLQRSRILAVDDCGDDEVKVSEKELSELLEILEQRKMLNEAFKSRVMLVYKTGTMLQQFPFYHGFIAREDMYDLLKKEGEYLLRVSEKDPMKDAPINTDVKKDIIISVHVGSRSTIMDKPTKEEVSINVEGPVKITNVTGPLVPFVPKFEKMIIKHVIVTRKGSTYCVEANKPFATLHELIAHYTKNYGYLRQNKFILKQAIPLQNWEHLHKDISVDQLLGEGAFGEVRRGVLTKRWNGKKVDVAVKLLKGTAGMTVGKDKIKEMMNEARLMRNFKHRNVVRMYGVAVHEQPIYIVLELIKGGCLSSFLKKNAGNTSMTDKINMSYGAALGIGFLHKNRCIHRDLAARNCLYTEEKIVKISDFGLSKNGVHHMSKSATRLPTKWLAPETISHRYFNLKTDVYSYGVLLYEIFADGGDPWVDTKTLDVKLALKEGKFLTLPPSCPDRIRSFIHEKIFTTEHKRATMAEICLFFETNMFAELDKSMFADELKASHLLRQRKSVIQTKPQSLSRK